MASGSKMETNLATVSRYEFYDDRFTGYWCRGTLII